MAPDIHHAVERRRAAEHASTRLVAAAAVECRLRLGVVAVVVRARLDDGFSETNRCPDQVVVVGAAVFEHGDADRRIVRQTSRNGATGGAGADHEIVVFA